jgi:hypothetical protein
VIAMFDRVKGRSGRGLKEAAGLVAVWVVHRVLQLGWRQVTGKEPPMAPDDRQSSLGMSMAWTVLLGAFAVTARMIVIRYVSILLPRAQRQDLPESAAEGPQDLPI